MKIKIVRIDQEVFNQEEIESTVNAETQKLIEAGSKIIDIRFEIGRDTETENISKKFVITFMILFQ